MKATLGAFALNIFLALLGVLVVTVVLLVAVPAAFKIPISWDQALALTTLLFLARGVFK